MVFRLLGYALLLPRVYHGEAARSSTPKDGNFAYIARVRLRTCRRSGASDSAGNSSRPSYAPVGEGYDKATEHAVGIAFIFGIPGRSTESVASTPPPVRAGRSW